MAKQSDSSFITVKEYVFKNLSISGILKNFDEKSPDFQETIKLEAVKIIFEKVRNKVSKIRPEKFFITQESMRNTLELIMPKDLQKEDLLEEYSVDENLSELLNHSKTGAVYSEYTKRFFYRYKAYAPNVIHIKTSVHKGLTDFIENVSFDTLAKILTTPNFINSFIVKNKTRQI